MNPANRQTKHEQISIALIYRAVLFVALPIMIYRQWFAKIVGKTWNSKLKFTCCVNNSKQRKKKDSSTLPSRHLQVLPLLLKANIAWGHSIEFKIPSIYTMIMPSVFRLTNISTRWHSRLLKHHFNANPQWKLSK